MRTVEHIVAEVRRLPSKERRRVLAALRKLVDDRNGKTGATGVAKLKAKKPSGGMSSRTQERQRARRKRPADRPVGKAPYAMSLALAGTGHSRFTDVSTDKYKHLAEIYADRHEDE